MIFKMFILIFFIFFGCNTDDNNLNKNTDTITEINNQILNNNFDPGQIFDLESNQFQNLISLNQKNEVLNFLKSTNNILIFLTTSLKNAENYQKISFKYVNFILLDKNEKNDINFKISNIIDFFSYQNNKTTILLKENIKNEGEYGFGVESFDASFEVIKNDKKSKEETHDELGSPDEYFKIQKNKKRIVVFHTEITIKNEKREIQEDGKRTIENIEYIDMKTKIKTIATILDNQKILLEFIN